VVALTGGGTRRGGAGGGASFGGMTGGMAPVTGVSSGMSISGGEGNSGCSAATVGFGVAGGGTNTLGGGDLWKKHDVLPDDNARMKGSSRDLNMVHWRKELEAESSSPAQLARKVDSTIM